MKLFKEASKLGSFYY